MLKKIILSLILISVGLCSFASEQLVTLYSPAKITTSDLNLKEGDEINFAISKDIYVNSKLLIKKDEKVTGIITSLEPNGFGCKEASIYSENFKTKSIDGKEIKLSGIIYKKGRTHWMFTQFIPLLPTTIRGGEVQIKQNDTFELILEEKL
jgi:hypothetical protein